MTETLKERTRTTKCQSENNGVCMTKYMDYMVVVGLTEYMYYLGISGQ